VVWIYITFFALIFLSAVFSASETAFTSLSPVQVFRLSSSKNPSKRLAHKLHQQVDLLITTILICNNLVNISATVFSTVIIIETYGESALTVGTAVLTLIIILFGEVVPKQAAISYNEAIASLVAFPLYLLMKVFYPVTWTISRLGDLFVFFLGGRRTREISLESILMMVRAAEQRGLLFVGQDRIVKNVFRSQTITVKSVMTHRTLMFSLNQNLKVGEAISRAMEEGYSRIPLYKSHPEEITGILFLKDLIQKHLKGENQLPLMRLMKPPLFIPESRKVNLAFWDMQAKNQSLAIVLDEYGGVAGLVTREDLLEEIFGEMYDEDEVAHDQFIQKREDGSYLVSGITPLAFLADYFKMPMEAERVTTFGGLLLQLAGKVPVEGDEIPTVFGKAIIQEMGRHRVVSAVLIPITEVTKLSP
jgi:putative hemolysin